LAGTAKYTGINSLNRHGILHGIFGGYGVEANFQKLVSSLDGLVFFISLGTSGISCLVKSTHTPCDVPVDFDEESFRRVGAAAAAFHGRAAWQSYASGMNAVAYRFAAADESHDSFVAAITASDAFSPSGPRYLQEVSLFSFFVNALSTIECACFAIYSLGLASSPERFPRRQATTYAR
jgi:hypothetical protein